MSYNRSILFPKPPSGFKVNHIGLPPVPASESSQNAISEYERGKQEASIFYKAEIADLRAKYANVESTLLSNIDAKVTEVLGKLDNRLPDLVIGLAERLLGQITLERDHVEKIVLAMVSEFSGEDEKLEVYLFPQDLSLLKAVANPDKAPRENENQEESGFASAIAGIFDGIDGDDALLEGYPNVKFFEDPSLNSGDCQIKSRFGLLDGRISTKIRKIEDELKCND